MNETGAYTEAVLSPMRERIDQLKDMIKRDSEDGKHPEPIVRLMTRKLEGVGEFSRTLHACQTADSEVERQHNELMHSLSFISVELLPLHQRLVALRRELAFMSGEPKLNKTEYKAILEELRKIDQFVSI